MNHFKKIYILILLPFGEFLFSQIGVVTLFRNEANYLKEWIEYHHMIGVDHFILYNDRSDDDWEVVLDPYIKSKLVTVIEWPCPPNTTVFPCWQVLAYKDGIKRFKGRKEWVAFIDIDEFILPLKNANIQDCIQQYFSHASGIYLQWINFGTSFKTINPKSPILFELTRASPKLHSFNASGKSIVRLEDVDVDLCWSPHFLSLHKQKKYYDGGGNFQPMTDNNLKSIIKHDSDIIRINHYYFRDERFFHERRLKNHLSGLTGELPLIMERYHSFNLEKNCEIKRFIKRHHRSKINFWER